MTDQYFTISNPSESTYKEKGSKFLAFAYPVGNEEEAIEKIRQLKKKYYDARHHCYAFILGRNGETVRSHDAGEPRHTAGDPILNQIRSGNLTDILVVVVRYFGGTKLGKSGLINAYKQAARDVLEQSRPVERSLKKILEIGFSYESINDIMRLIDEHQLNLLDQEYGEKHCSVKIHVNESEVPGLMNKIETISHIHYLRESTG